MAASAEIHCRLGADCCPLTTLDEALMAQRTVTDGAGRAWTCTPANGPQKMGLDVKLSCTTPGVKEPVLITVGWAWETMANNGLARMISQAAAA